MRPPNQSDDPADHYGDSYRNQNQPEYLHHRIHNTFPLRPFALEPPRPSVPSRLRVKSPALKQSLDTPSD